MVTMVGKERDVLELLYDLIELDYDAIEAYDAAIERINDTHAKAQLTLFRADHQRHVQELSQSLKALGEEPPRRGDAKKLLTKGKVVLMGLAGDRAILMAMRSNEQDTNTAYERASQRELPAPIATLVQNNLADERRHRDWIEERIRLLEESA